MNYRAQAKAQTSSWLAALRAPEVKIQQGQRWRCGQAVGVGVVQEEVL